MQTQNRIFEDIARLANGAAGLASGFREEIETLVKHRLDRLLSDMDLVTREEFDAVKEMAANARAEQDTLAKKLAALEKRVAALKKSVDTKAKPDS
jgi:BMFP domain-containing protein YqiC